MTGIMPEIDLAAMITRIYDRAAETVEICCAAGQPHRAVEFLRQEMGPEAVRRRLTSEALPPAPPAPTRASPAPGARPAVLGHQAALEDAARARFAAGSAERVGAP